MNQKNSTDRFARALKAKIILVLTTLGIVLIASSLPASVPSRLQIGAASSHIQDMQQILVKGNWSPEIMRAYNATYHYPTPNNDCERTYRQTVCSTPGVWPNITIAESGKFKVVYNWRIYDDDVIPLEGTRITTTSSRYSSLSVTNGVEASRVVRPEYWKLTGTPYYRSGETHWNYIGVDRIQRSQTSFEEQARVIVPSNDYPYRVDFFVVGFDEAKSWDSPPGIKIVGQEFGSPTDTTIGIPGPSQWGADDGAVTLGTWVQNIDVIPIVTNTPPAASPVLETPIKKSTVPKTATVKPLPKKTGPPVSSHSPKSASLPAGKSVATVPRKDL